MLIVTHPKADCRREQEAFLERTPSPGQRYWVLMFSHTNACYRYYQQTNNIIPTEEDFSEWLEGLPENVRKAEKKEGFERAKSSIPFRRYVLEKADIGLKEYVRELMGAENYAEFELSTSPNT